MLRHYAARYTGAVWVTGVTLLSEALTLDYTRPSATRPLLLDGLWFKSSSYLNLQPKPSTNSCLQPSTFSPEVFGRRIIPHAGIYAVEDATFAQLIHTARIHTAAA